MTDFNVGPEFWTHTETQTHTLHPPPTHTHTHTHTQPHTHTYTRARVCNLKDSDSTLFFKESSVKLAEVFTIFFYSLPNVSGLVESCFFGSVSRNKKLSDKTPGLGRDLSGCRSQLKCDGTRANTRFILSAKRTSPFKTAGASVQSTTGSRSVRISFYCW